MQQFEDSADFGGGARAQQNLRRAFLHRPAVAFVDFEFSRAPNDAVFADYVTQIGDEARVNGTIVGITHGAGV
jgi:ABC-type uncharacterized transport system YnjBCD ATPase subunit